MNVPDALRSAVAVMTRRPGAVLPVFLAGTAVSLVAMVVPIVAAALAVASWSVTGRLGAAKTALAGVEVAPTPEPTRTGFQGQEQVVAAVRSLVSPEVVAIAVLAVVGFAVVYVVAGSVASAARVSTAVSALTGGDPVDDGVVGARTHTWRFLAVAIAEVVGYGVPLLVLVVPVALLGADPVLGALAFGAGLLFVTPILLIVFLALLFVPQAIVVDGLGVFASVRRNAGFIRANPARVGVYLVVSLGIAVAVGVMTASFQFFGVARFAAVLSAVVATPVLVLFKTAIYLDVAPVEPAGIGFPAQWSRAMDAFADGLSALRRFVVDHPVAVTAAFGVFAVGAFAGWYTAIGVRVAIARPGTVADIFGVFPVDVFVEIAANNWLVSVGTAFAGLAFGVPTLAALFANGAILGGVSAIAGDLGLVAAFVAPHGVVEVPALSVAGALGLVLGRTGFAYARGSVSSSDLAVALDTVYRVLLGLVPVFVLAAMIEAFVTPWVVVLLG